MTRRRLLHGAIDAPIWIAQSALAIGVITLSEHLAQAQEVAIRWRVVAFSPDGTRLAAGAGEPKQAGRVAVWSVDGWDLQYARGETEGVPALAFSPDGKTLAYGSFEGRLRFVDLDSRKVGGSWKPHESAVRSVCFSPDGKMLATASYDRTIKLWDLPAMSERKTLQGHTDIIYSLAFSPDGSQLASASRDASTRVWSVATGAEIHLFEPSDLIARHVSFSPDGRWLATARWDGYVRVRDARSGSLTLEIRHSSGGVDCAVFRPDGRMLATARRNIDLYELDFAEATPQQLERIRELLARLDNDDIRVREQAADDLQQLGLAAEPSLRRAMTEAQSAEVRMRARLTREKIRSPEPLTLLKGQQAEYIAFSPDGKLLASANRDGTVKIWDVATAKPLAVLSEL